jgi:hypothetical protein
MNIRFALSLAFFAQACVSNAYVLENIVWGYSNPTIYVNLSASQGALGSRLPSFPLLDGTGTFDQVFFAAVASWNSYLLNLQIAPVEGSNPKGVDTSNNINEVGFAAVAGGDNLGAETLAITEIYYYPGNPNTFAPTDIVFNSSGIYWNSYRGPLSSTVIDLRRVALHELGHFIGLDHPDQYGQSVNAIMNSVISNTDQLTADDIAGGQFLYGARTVTPPADFVGNRLGDILWRNLISGEVSIWIMNGANILQHPVVGTASLDWQILGVGDFDGSGRSSILWSNSVTGQLSVWFLNGGTLISNPSFYLSGVTGTIQAIGDLSGDSHADLVVHDSQNGNTWIFLNEGVPNFSVSWAGNVTTDWEIAGIAKIAGNGTSQLIWRNRVTGQVAAWFFSGGVPVQFPIIGSADLAWQIKGFGDVNGDGREDIIWQNQNTGQVSVWLMDGTQLIGFANPGSAVYPWVFGGTYYPVANGAAQIVWRNNLSGQVWTWTVNSSSFSSVQLPLTPTADWVLQ